MSKSILVITLPPLTGGVPDKTKLLVRHLRKLGHRVTVSHYATYTDYPELVVTLWQLLKGKKPKTRSGVCFEDFPCISVGCWLPEFEFTYYQMSDYWRKLINEHQRHIVVGGTILTSYAITSLGIPHLVWCASTMIEDRIARRHSMPLPRRILDQFIISPIQFYMEQKILNGKAQLMAVSSYTLRSLTDIGCKTEQISKVPIPVDLEKFKPPFTAPKPGVIGFAGRPEDPRKNLALLFHTLKILLKKNKSFKLILTGSPQKSLEYLAYELGISEHIFWKGWLTGTDLPSYYHEIDIFVIPSTQEGLNIAGLQAMASAIPIVSTQCGGPEDYVIDGKTGTIVSFDPDNMASAICAITDNRKKRNELGRNARQFVEKNYNQERFEQSFAHSWHQIWGDQP